MNKWQKLLGGAAAMAMVLATIPASAQTPVKFTLDWVFQGPTSPFLVALEKGYYKAEGLDVTMDPGQGSAGAVQRVATGAYQIGFADVNATIEYNAKNPGKEVLCVFMAYDFAPFGVYALKKSGIKSIAELAGKPVTGAPFEITRKLWPMFAKAAKVDAGSVKWTNVDPALRTNAVIKGDVVAAGGFYNIPLEFEARGGRCRRGTACARVDFPSEGRRGHGRAEDGRRRHALDKRLHCLLPVHPEPPWRPRGMGKD